MNDKLRLALTAAAVSALLVNNAYAGSAGATTGAATSVTGWAVSTGNATTVSTGVATGTAVGVAVSAPGTNTTTTFAGATQHTTSKTHVGAGGAAASSVTANGLASANAWTTP